MLNQQQRFANLDGIRFFGALLVFLFHCATLHREIWGDFYNGGGFQIVIKLFSFGHLGVNLFFVLSGFLLTSLMLQEVERTGKINVVHFLMRRTLRLWPLYFVIVLFGFFVFPVLPYGIETVHELWRFALFLSNIDEILVGMRDQINFLTATWSISVEEQYYLGWSLLLLVFSFRKKNTFVLFFSIIILGSLIFRFLNMSDERTIYYHTFSVISDFSIGGFGALLVTSKQFVSNLVTWSKGKQFLSYAAILVVVGCSEKLLVGKLIVPQRIIISLAFLLFILIQVSAKNVLLPFDSVRFFKQTGKRTYGFYLFHCIVIYYWAMIFKDHHLTDSQLWFWTFTFLSFVCTTLLAFLSYRFFEEPILKLKRYFP